MRRRGKSKNWKSLASGALLTAMLLAVGVRALRALPHDTVADRELGQPDFFHNASNIPEPDVMNQPVLIAIDKSLTPNRLYVADSQNNRVLGYKRVDALVSGQVADLVIGQPDLYSAACHNGGPTRYSLCVPVGVAVDSAGNLFVADYNNNRVLEYNQPFASGLTANQPASWVLGQGGGFTSGSCNLGGGSANPTGETLCRPIGLAIDAKGNLYVADSGNNRILEYSAPFNTAFAASRVFGQFGNLYVSVSNNMGPPAYKSGTPSARSLSDPMGISLDAAGNLYVADYNNNRVLRYNARLASDTANQVFGQLGNFTTNKSNDGGLNAKSLFNPAAIGFDTGGDVYISDFGNNRVLEYRPPIASNPTANRVFGQANKYNINVCNILNHAPSSGTLCGPDGVLTDSSGNLYVSDNGNNRVLKYKVPFYPSDYAQVVIGQPDARHKSANTVDPTAMYNPAAVVVDAAGHLFVADLNNNRVLGYRSAAGFTSGGPADLVIGQPDFYSGACNQGGVYPTRRTLCGPQGVAVDGLNNLYVADFNNNRVLAFGPPFSSRVTVDQAAVKVFGQGGSFTSRGQNSQRGVSSKSLYNPISVAVDRGKVFVSYYNNDRVLEFVPPIGTNPSASVVLGQAGFMAQGCNNSTNHTPAANTMCTPQGVAVDLAGNLYVSDNGNSRVLLFRPPFKTSGKATRGLRPGQFRYSGVYDCQPLWPLRPYRNRDR